MKKYHMNGDFLVDSTVFAWPLPLTVITVSLGEAQSFHMGWMFVPEFQMWHVTQTWSIRHSNPLATVWLMGRHVV